MTKAWARGDDATEGRLQGAYYCMAGAGSIQARMVGKMAYRCKCDWMDQRWERPGEMRCGTRCSQDERHGRGVGTGTGLGDWMDEGQERPGEMRCGTSHETQARREMEKVGPQESRWGAWKKRGWDVVNDGHASTGAGCEVYSADVKDGRAVRSDWKRRVVGNRSGRLRYGAGVEHGQMHGCGPTGCGMWMRVQLGKTYAINEARSGRMSCWHSGSNSRLPMVFNSPL